MERLTEYESIAGHAHAIPIGSDMDVVMMRLAAYEDAGLTPGEVHSLWGEWNAMMRVLNSIGGYDRLRELAEADKEGRVAVLTCKVGGSMLDMSDIEHPEIMKRLHFAVAYESVSGIIFYQPYNIFCENVDAGHIKPLSKDTEKALEAMKDE